MVKKFVRNLKVDASMTDVNVKMSLVSALTVAQDNMCEFFKELGCDGITMIPVRNCFFVLTKSKIVFNKHIGWLDLFSAESQFVGKSRVRVNLQTDFYANGDNVATCVYEMCAMDLESRSIRSLDSTLFPVDLEVSKASSIELSKFTFELDEECFWAAHIVDVSNLDFYKHMNNLQYVQLMIANLDLEFFENHTIEEFEIHYICESRIDDELTIYRKVESDKVLFQIKSNDKTITKAILKYK